MSQMIHVNLALMNGHAGLVTFPPSCTVQDVRIKAQHALGKKCLRLITAKNRVLVDPETTLEEVEIEDGECLTALALQPQLAATEDAFAMFCHGENPVVACGDADYGGDSSAVRDQLKGVQHIRATPNGTFAAILADGSVVTWRKGKGCGGDSSAVRDQLKGVQHVQATPNGAFAAILADGSVVTWGNELCGGDSSAIQDQLKGVQQIQATHYAFAAILADRSVLTWGHQQRGGDSSAVRDQLKGADSGNSRSICCDSGRWVGRDLG